ncbi:MAG: hypothetical protein KatS3mg008_0937 [Acidimicrobiales bacterium]|nr:MAG: hypothetical protein KatS3mg008_0937 [Acidimicrobiales bacterium]
MTRTFERVLHDIRDVRGWLTPAQARLLWERASALKEGDRIVEIGSFQGRSTIVLAGAAQEGVEVIAIDAHFGTDRGPQEIVGKHKEAQDDRRRFLENLERTGLRDRVTYRRQWSQEALEYVRGDVDLLYIDGAHRYVPARDDIRRWGDRVVPGGVMLVHDAFSAIGVTLALATSTFLSSEWRYVGRVGSMAEFRKEPLSRREVARNAIRQARELPWFLRNLAIKFLIAAGLRPLTRYLGFDPRQDWPY